MGTVSGIRKFEASLSRCPRCDGPLFVSGDRDYGVCLTHGDQFIGRIPGADELERPARRSSARRMGWRLYS
jgi:hypothetical protein